MSERSTVIPNSDKYSKELDIFGFNFEQIFYYKPGLAVLVDGCAICFLSL